MAFGAAKCSERNIDSDSNRNQNMEIQGDSRSKLVKHRAHSKCQDGAWFQTFKRLRNFQTGWFEACGWVISKVLSKVVAKSADFASSAAALSTATQDLAYAQVPTLPGNFSGAFQGWYHDVYLKF